MKYKVYKPENMIIRFLDEHNYKADIQIFLKSDELIEYLENEDDMDMLFLDIELDESTGIEIGKNIRDTMQLRKIYKTIVKVIHGMYRIKLTIMSKMIKKRVLRG